MTSRAFSLPTVLCRNQRISRAEFFEEIVLFPRLILSTPNADLASVSQAIKIGTGLNVQIEPSP